MYYADKGFDEAKADLPGGKRALSSKRMKNKAKTRRRENFSRNDNKS